MRYHHLSTFERGRIDELLTLGYSHRAIANRLGRHHSCIDRELNRNKSDAGYACISAQSACYVRRCNSKPRGKRSDSLISIIEEKLSATWSPEQIASTVTLGVVSFKTIYNWLYAGKLHDGDIWCLRHKGKRRKAEKRGKFSMGTSILERPKEVKYRQTFSHWELDTMVSSRGESKGCFATFVERKSRLYTALLIPDRTASGQSHSFIVRCRKVHSKQAQPTAAKSLPVTARYKHSWHCRTILPMPIHHGKEAVTRTPTDCYESSIPRKQIWEK